MKHEFHLLDTFEGMPENGESSPIFTKGAFLADLEQVKAKVAKHNTEGLKVNDYKGLFSANEESFHRGLSGRKIAVANIDCDLEFSTVDALSMIEPHMTTGTIVLFDDYNTFKADSSKGQRKAFFDFKQTSSYSFEKFFNYHYSGQSFIVVGEKKVPPLPHLIRKMINLFLNALNSSNESESIPFFYSLHVR